MHDTGTTIERVIIAFLAALPPTITALAVLAVALKGAKKLEKVRGDMNGRLDQLIDAEKRASAASAAKDILEHPHPPAPPPTDGEPPR